MYDDEDRATDAACSELLDHVLRGERSWMDELAPGGVGPTRRAASSWTTSAEVSGRGGEWRRPPEARRAALDRGRPFKELRDRWLGFLGDVLWDVFSDNHDVVGPGGERYDLGSFRGTGGFLADHLNDRLAAEGDEPGPEVEPGPFDYIDFYWGRAGSSARAARRTRPPAVLRPRVREAAGARVRLAVRPAAIGVVRFDRPDEETDDPARYDPNAALAAEAERDEKEEQLGEFARQLAEANAEAFERAVREPPLVVRAYREVYGEWPVYVRH